MPADPIHPDQLDGEQRFRADLAAYLDSLPVPKLAELLGELPSRHQQPLQRKTDELIDQGKIRGAAVDRVRQAVAQFSRAAERSG